MHHMNEITRKLFVVFCVIGLMLTLVQCKPDQTFPEEGIWYCAELQMQMCFDKEQEKYDTYAIVNGEKFRCAVSTDYGNRFFGIEYEDTPNEKYNYDTCFYSGEFISFNDERIVTRDTQTQVEYVFVRVSE